MSSNSSPTNRFTTTFEQLKLANSLTWLAVELGYSTELVQQILAGKSPQERAAELIKGTKVKDVDFRKRLYNEGNSALADAKDPMIELARLIDPEARALRKIIEAQTEAKQQAHAQIGKARLPFLAPGPIRTRRLRCGWLTAL